MRTVTWLFNEETYGYSPPQKVEKCSSSVLHRYEFQHYHKNIVKTSTIVCMDSLMIKPKHVGTNRRISDSGVWNKCTLKSMLDNNEIKFPKASSLPNSNVSFPFVLVGDEGFPLSTKLLIPYPRIQSSGRKDRRIFNYRLSRARRTSENDFGVYNTRFQIFRSPIRYDPDIATLITQCCCVLHNFLRSKEIGRLLCTSESMLDTEDVYSRVVRPGEWREKSVGGTNFVHQGGNRHSNAVIHLRNEWCAYFNSTGAAP